MTISLQTANLITCISVHTWKFEIEGTFMTIINPIPVALLRPLRDPVRAGDPGGLRGQRAHHLDGGRARQGARRPQEHPHHQPRRSRSM